MTSLLKSEYKTFVYVLIMLFSFIATAQKNIVLDGVTYQLVWADEFTVNGEPDSVLWQYENGFVRNEELQWYQAQNAYCLDGNLVIEGRKENIPNPDYTVHGRDWRITRKTADYTSASLNTRGKKEMLYGLIEVRAKIPTASGAWPAIWTLGVDMPWPSNGEIDILEYYRINDEPHILANFAWGADKNWDAKWNSVKVPFSEFLAEDKDWADKFHVWKMNWTRDSIHLFLDNRLMNKMALHKVKNGAIGEYSNPFRQPHYLLLNLAIGGVNGGIPDDATFPLKYYIDYVRVFQEVK